jgi:hypothetical protein
LVGAFFQAPRACGHSTVLVDVLDPATLFQSVHHWRRDFDNEISTLPSNLDALGVKQISDMTVPVLESQALALIKSLRQETVAYPF